MRVRCTTCSPGIVGVNDTVSSIPHKKKEIKRNKEEEEEEEDIDKMKHDMSINIARRRVHTSAIFLVLNA